MQIKYICFAIIVLCLISSCAKKKPVIETGTYQMSATVSGLTWSVPTLKATNSGGVDSVIGIRASDTSKIILLFPSGPKAGDTLSVGSINTVEYVKSHITYVAVSGSIVIEAATNNSLIGTFQATVEDFNSSNKIAITGGKFNANF